MKKDVKVAEERCFTRPHHVNKDSALVVGGLFHKEVAWRELLKRVLPVSRLEVKTGNVLTLRTRQGNGLTGLEKVSGIDCFCPPKQVERSGGPSVRSRVVFISTRPTRVV